MAINDISGDTVKFSAYKSKAEERKAILKFIYEALREKGGYDPIDQIVGYLLSEDPGYITNHKNARSMIRKIDRDELLYELVKEYLGIEE